MTGRHADPAAPTASRPDPNGRRTLFSGVDDLLADARSRIRRVAPMAAARAVGRGALLVDIRPAWQRAADGEIPGSLVVERNHLEWRLDPGSSARLPQASGDQQWIVFCTEGYTSSLAADALRSLNLTAADLDGGFYAWRAAGLPITHGVTEVEAVVAVGR